MYNEFNFIGRLVQDLKIEKYGVDNDKDMCNFTLAIPRSYKNENGEYDADFVDITIYNQIALNTCEYCKKGDLIGVKGRVETSYYENKNGEKKKRTTLIGNSVSFLSCRKNVDMEN